MNTVNGKESDLVSSVVRSKYKSLLDIVSSTLVSLTKYVTVIDYNKSGITKDYSLLIKKDFKSGIEKSSEVLNVNEILVENESVIDKHYSKENNKLITTDTKRNIEFGKYVISRDKKRSNYYNYYTTNKWGQLKNFDLTINSDYGLDEAAEIIAEMYKKL